jgi:hypothetical protein
MKKSSLLGLSLAAMLAAPALAGGTTATLALSASPTIKVGETFVLSVNIADFPANAVGAQATVSYDATKVSFVSIAAGTDFDTLIYSSHDSVNGTVLFASGVSPSAPTTGVASGNIAQITLTANTVLCSADIADIVDGLFANRVTDASGNAMTFTESETTSVIALDAFTLANVPGAVSVAADAGTTAGALVTLTAPTATDSCSTSLTVTPSRSDSALMTDPYPVGTTTVTWTATDAAGNSDSATTTVEVLNHQLLDFDVTLAGTISGNSTRSIRLTAGADVQVVSVALTGATGSAADVQVPVEASYACLEAKDTVHSLTDTAAATVVGVKYDSAFTLKQGDSNNDDLVDILDFGIYVGDFGAAVEDGRSNFDADLLVDNADFSFISVNFFQRGETCTSGFDGGEPIAAIKVKDLRRMGLGHLAAADLDRDGWLDANDVAYAMQYGIPARKNPIRVAPGQ